MSERNGAQARIAAARAMEQVLRAEREAEAELNRRRAEAAQSVERARDEARAIVNRALERAARWQERHARALAGRVETMRARAAAAQGVDGIDPALLAQAVERLAVRLTGDETDAAR
jgi:vacuolar-type H+-ATPase subunit H